MSIKKETFTTFLIFFICCFLTFFSISAIEKHNSKITSTNSIVLDDKWSLSINNKDPYTNVNLSSFSFHTVTKNDKILLQRNINQPNIVFPQLTFSSIYSAVSVYINDTKIFSYGQNEKDLNKQVYCSRHYIPLDKIEIPENSLLSIVFDVTEFSAFSSIEPPVIDQANNQISTILNGGMICFLISVFLFMLGAIGTIASVCGLSLKKQVRVLLSISQFSFWTGLGVLGDNGFLEIFSFSPQVVLWIEYIALFFMPFSLTGVFYDMIATTKKQKSIAFYYVVIIIAYSAFSLILHFFNAVHLPSMLIGFQTLLIIGLALGFVLSIKNIKSSPIKKSFSAFGFVFMILLSFLDIIRYLLNKYTNLNISILHSSQFSIGVIVFISCTLISFVYMFSENLEKICKSQKTNSDTRFDYLTGLYNRKEVFTYLSKLNQQQEKNYVVAFIEIPHLYMINSQKGSYYSNKIITKIAQKLKTVFSNYGIIGRMSENRFILIANDIFETKLKQLFYVFKNLLLSDFICKEIQVNYGYAFGYEDCVTNTDEVCNLASIRQTQINQASLTTQI